MLTAEGADRQCNERRSEQGEFSRVPPQRSEADRAAGGLGGDRGRAASYRSHEAVASPVLVLPELSRFPTMVRCGDSPDSGLTMTDDTEMRLRLQQVAAYRELCRGVRRSGRDNIVFAALMAFLAYMVWKGGPNAFLLVFYGILIGSDLAVGLYKWAFPSAEGHLFDGLVLLLFAGVNLGFQFLGIQGGGRPNPIIILFGLLILSQAINRFRYYAQLRRLFAVRPSAEHMAWFDDLVREIHAADPEFDDLALDLPTSPRWRAKLLGSMVFLVTSRGDEALVVGPEDLEIRREKIDRGSGRRRAVIRIDGIPYPEFEITNASWANYQKWRAAYPLPDSPPTAVSESG